MNWMFWFEAKLFWSSFRQLLSFLRTSFEPSFLLKAVRWILCKQWLTGSIWLSKQIRFIPVQQGGTSHVGTGTRTVWEWQSQHCPPTLPQERADWWITCLVPQSGSFHSYSSGPENTCGSSAVFQSLLSSTKQAFSMTHSCWALCSSFCRIPLHVKKHQASNFSLEIPWCIVCAWCRAGG